MTIQLSYQQASCVKSVASWYKTTKNWDGFNVSGKVFCIGGYAGSGKSTILPFIIEELGLDLSKVAFGAPTANAAKVMTRKLNAYGLSAQARTIHSLIYLVKPTRAEILEGKLVEQQMLRNELLKSPDAHDTKNTNRLHTINTTIKLLETDLDKALDDTNTLHFSLNVNSAIRECSLIVIDEGSMVGQEIANDLEQFDVPILVLGDPGQLPPVQDISGFTIDTPDFMLSEIHRQALDSPIIRLSFEAREGRMLKAGNYGDGVKVVDRRHDDVTFNLDIDAQVIVGTHKKRWFITQKLRKAMGFNSTGPCADEPLMVCKNSKAMPTMINGSVVTCMKDMGSLVDGNVSLRIPVKDELGEEFEVFANQGLFEEHFLKMRGASTTDKRHSYRSKIVDEHLDWGWVLTCHKSQGNQWKNVVLHDESGVFREFSSNWLYTGITRAEEGLTVII